MNPLLEAHAFLADGLRHDPLLCLASAVASLDPLWTGGDMDDWTGDDRDILRHALSVVRLTFPDIYVQAVAGLQQGMNQADLDHLICQSLNAIGIPLDDLEWLGYSIPVPAYGIHLADPELPDLHPDVLPILRLFGVEAGDLDIPDRVYHTGHLLATSLAEQEETPYQQVACALGWLFACSGNTCVDTDDENLCAYEPLAWNPEEVAYALELIHEAETLMAHVAAGLDLLATDATLIAALRHNIRRIDQALLRRKGRKPHDWPIRLAWPRLADRPD